MYKCLIYVLKIWDIFDIFENITIFSNPAVYNDSAELSHEQLWPCLAVNRMSIFVTGLYASH